MRQHKLRIMSGNIWKSYLCTAVKKWDISDPRSCEHNWTSSWKETWKKFRSVRNLNPLPLRYRSSALRTELTSLLGASLYVGHIWKSYLLHIHDFHKFPVIIHHLEGLFGSNKKKAEIHSWIKLLTNFWPL